MLSGEADLLIVADEPVPTETRQRLRPGSFVYYPAYQRHTLHNPGPECATYLMFKWRSAPAADNVPLGTLSVDFLPAESRAASGKDGFYAWEVLNGATRYLRRLHAHVSTLQPGAGYHPHADAHDVAILTIDGTVETLGQQIGPGSLIFYAARETHGMKNVGTSPCVYLVFEFHGDNPRFSGRIMYRVRSLARLPLRLWRRMKRIAEPVLSCVR